MKKLLIAGMALGLSHGACHAMSSHELMNKLQSTDAAVVLQGHAYINGVTDSEATFLTAQKFAMGADAGAKLSAAFFCVPEGISTRKIVDIITPKIEEDRQARRVSANAMIRRVLIGIWPCPNNP